MSPSETAVAQTRAQRAHAFGVLSTRLMRQPRELGGELIDQLFAMLAQTLGLLRVAAHHVAASAFTLTDPTSFTCKFSATL
jgi:hypothetical protein